MYTLLSGLYKYMFRRDEYCILILGLDNAGKTVCALLACQHRRHKPLHSLFPRSTTMRAKTNLFPGVASVISVVLLQTFLEQTKTRFNRAYKGMSLSKITTTVGLNIGTIDVGKARLMFWDLGGQDELQSLWDKYYAESHGVIYVIDSTDEERLSESKRAFEKVVTSEALEGVPILVLANKQDVEDPSLLLQIQTNTATPPILKASSDQVQGSARAVYQFLTSKQRLVTALTKLEGGTA
ncbi:ADP-ribosylation factor-related protein 1 isoform X2 [Carettochelys insculpta]|uniref:ADP-ribosylation factor-related protein 1 isoform X2 n=1 Tax=Carettochelys insculpta TaxID=44489 RepID=UPI003EBCCBF3